MVARTRLRVTLCVHFLSRYTFLLILVLVIRAEVVMSSSFGDTSFTAKQKPAAGSRVDLVWSSVRGRGEIT